MKISQKQLEFLQHSLGVDEYGRGQRYRNRFITYPTSQDGEVCQALVALGLMQDHGPRAIAGGMHHYSVTPAGERAMMGNSPTPPKLTRSQQRYKRFQEMDSGMSFGEFLKCKI